MFQIFEIHSFFIVVNLITKQATRIQDTGKSPLTCLFENPVTAFYGDEEVSFVAMECKAAILLSQAHKLAMEMCGCPLGKS